MKRGRVKERERASEGLREHIEIQSVFLQKIIRQM